MDNYYILRNESIKQQAAQDILSCDHNVLHEVEIRPVRQKRSLSQSRLYWKWLQEIAQQMEVEGEKITKEDWHHLCRMKWLGVKVVSIGGKEYPRPAKSTTKLKVGEMAEYLTQIESHFLEKGVALSFPDDYGAAMGKS